MPLNSGATQAFINLLRAASARDQASGGVLLDADDLKELLKSDHPQNPLERSSADVDRIRHGVMKNAFDRVLEGGPWLE